MRTVGIIAEYNPFHNGHLYHIARSRELTGAERVVCVMSGDFVQRGEAAVFSKFARAEAAVRAGANLVLELPLPWSIASAEGFARGGAGLLDATGVVDCLSFGSECGDTAAFYEVTDALDRSETEEALRRALESGLSYPAARERAVGAVLGEEKAALLRSPNNILGIEYLRALSAQGSALRPVTVKREGGEHDGENSASELRSRLGRGESIRALTPESCAEIWDREAREGRFVTMPALETALLSRLRLLPLSAYRNLPDASEGLENRLYAAARAGESWEAILDSAAAKRYPRARLRRMLLCAALGIEKGMAEGIPPYIRPLAADDVGLQLLSEMKNAASLPVISRGGDVRKLGGRAEAIFDLGSRAHDLYVLGCRAGEGRKADEDYRKAPVIFCK